MNDVVVPEYLLIYVPVVVWLLNYVKSAINSDKFKRFVPGIAIVGGVALSLLAGDGDVSLRAKILGGLLMGVAASGFYETLKSSNPLK